MDIFDRVGLSPFMSSWPSAPLPSTDTLSPWHLPKMSFHRLEIAKSHTAVGAPWPAVVFEQELTINNKLPQAPAPHLLYES